MSGAPDLSVPNSAPSAAKPCPFCGGAAVTLNNGYTDCTNADCAPRLSVAAWNRRLTPEGVIALIEQETMIERAQDIITNYLVPDGYTAEEAIALLIEHFDGPNQRRVKAIVDHALASVTDGTAPDPTTVRHPKESTDMGL